MMESPREKIAKVRALVEEYHRLDARMAELSRKLTADSAVVLQIKDQLARQRREAAERSRAADLQVRRAPESPTVVLDRMKQEKLRVALEDTQKELDAVLARLMRWIAPAGAVRAAAPTPHSPSAPAPSDAVDAAQPVVVLTPDDIPVAEEVHEAPPPVEHEPPAKAEAHEVAAPAAEPDHSLVAQEKAIREAVETGREAMASADRLRTAVEEIVHGGLWHALAGVVRPHSASHAKIDEARAAAHETREKVRKFRDEVADLRTRFGTTGELGEVEALAGRLDDLLEGKAHDEQGIRHLPGRLLATYHEVRGLCASLQLEANRLRIRRMKHA